MTIFSNARLRANALCSASILTIALAAPGLAAAQTAPVATTVEGVVVTASRIVRDGYTAPTPTTVVGAADIEKQSVSNIANYLNLLPALGSAAGSSPRTTNFGSGNLGGTNSFNARNLGTARTLTLLDGHRVVGANLTGVVDINLLPTNLVARVDVVTGGASAAWGSDAVGGVVNFVLDKRFVGLKGSFGYGSSWKGDGTTVNADVAFGAKFAGDRGHILLSAQLEQEDGIYKNSSRDWYTGYKAVPNTAHTATNGIAGFTATNNAGLRLATSGGVITAGPLAGVQFGPGGTVLPYRLATSGSGLIGAGGDVEDIGGEYPITAAAKNQALFGRISYDLTDHVNAYIEVGQGWDYGNNYTSHFIRHGDLTIKADNAFIPAALNLQGVTQFNIGRVQNEPELGNLKIKNTRYQERYVVGAEGDVDWFNNSFKWNAYYQRGVTHQYAESSHDTRIAYFLLAVDAVRNPAVGGVPGIAAGVPVCRSTIANPTNGCQPFNVFGRGSPSKASLDYVAGQKSYQHVHIQQDVAAAGFQLEPFSVPAGPVSLAGGLEWRKEQYRNAVDPVDADPANGNAPFWFGNYKLGKGEYNVKEGFLETIVPLVKNFTLIKSLDFNGAVRSTDYSTSGRVTTWKAGGTWDVNDDLRFRGTRSRDIRAPNLNDLFLAGTGSGGGILVPGTNFQQFITSLSGGNPNLVPEIADTTAYGVVYRPSWFPGFSASIDRYKININKAIVALSSQQIINACYGVGVPVNPASCANITLNPNPATPGLAGQFAGAIIRVGGANIANQNVSGYDIEVSYRRALSDIYEPLPGSIDLRAIGNHLTRFTQTVNGVTTNYKDMVFSGIGPIAGGPNWRWLFTGSYELGPSTTTLTVRYVGKAVINNEPISSSTSVDKKNIRSIEYLDINEAWNLDMWGAKATLFAKIENVFDADPPKVASTQGTAYAASGTDFAYYDEVGRFWRVGLRFKY